MHRANKKNKYWLFKLLPFFLTSILIIFHTAFSYADFVNGDFEATYAPSSANTYNPIFGWTLTGYTFNANTVSVPHSLNDINISSVANPPVITGSPGGISDMVIAPNQTWQDYFLFGGMPATLALLPIQGNQTVMVNLRSIHPPLAKAGTSLPQGVTMPGWFLIPQQATSISQQVTISAADFDPNDHKVHVRFKIAPVLQNPGHTPEEQPFVAVQLNNITTGRIGSNPLFFVWNYAGQAGIPWIPLTTAGTNPGSATNYEYTNWQALDIAPGNAFIHEGDTIELVVLGSGCSRNGHDGHVYIDQVHTFIPPVLWVAAAGPASAAPGQSITYTYTYTNQGTTAVSNVSVVANLPQNSNTIANTIFVSATNPTVGTSPNRVCTGTGPVTCTIGTLQPGETGTFQLTVTIPNAWSTADVVNNGNYPISGQGVVPLLGPLVQTAINSAAGLSNLVANTSTLPIVATQGTPYTGTFTCVNTSTVNATGDAENASCDIVNLPAGLAVTGCTITPNSSTWIEPDTIAANQTVTCTVTGTPTSTGQSTVTATANATNNSNSTTNQASTTITVNLAQYAVTPSGDSHESISPNTVQTVNSGSTTTFTVTPNAGYTLSAVGGDCPAGTWRVGNQYTTGSITGNCSVSFGATLNQYTVTPAGDDHETISPNTAQTVNYGGTQTFTVTPNAGYTLSAVGGNCPAGTWRVGNQYTTGSITGNCSVSFGATLNQYTVTPAGDGHETISPNTAQTVNYGGTQTFTVTPNAGYTLSAVGGDCPAGTWRVGNQYTTGSITGNCSISFGATLNQYTVTPAGDGHETISPNTAQTVNYGGTQTFTVTPNAGYTLSAVGGDCPAGTWVGNQYTTGSITSNCSVSFGAVAENKRYTITPRGDGYERITPNKSIKVNVGETQTFIVTPFNSFGLAKVVKGSCPKGRWSGFKYTTGPITKNCVIIFSAIPRIIASMPNGSPVNNKNAICCGRPVLLSPLANTGNGLTRFTLVSKTGSVICKIGYTAKQAYLKMYGQGSCTIVGTKNGMQSIPLTLNSI